MMPPRVSPAAAHGFRVLSTRSVTAIAYRFGDFHLDPAARELRRNGELLRLPRRVFDGLAYLVEHRDRAVGHDELISALWGRVDVANAQVSQLVMQLRRAVDDDSNAQRCVRTVSGFGYRWTAATEVLAATARAESASESGRERSPATPRRWRATAALALAALAALVLALTFPKREPSAPAAPVAAPAIAVLPFAVDAPEDANASWVRLGAMDLVASRLREAGLPVPPSDSVVAALHAAASRPEADRLDAIAHALGAATLVQGSAARTKDGWTVELVARGGEMRQRVEIERAEIVDGARRSADLLLAALGKPRPDAGVPDEALDVRLQRARAAMLAGETDTARAILADAPEPMRGTPELRYELARIGYHAGRLDETLAIVDALIEANGTPTALRARALRMRGWARLGQGAEWAAVEREFDASVAALGSAGTPGDLGKALAERGVARVFLRRYEEAALDLGRARSELEAAGDRQTLGEMDNYLGQLEFMRHRVTESLGYFRNAAEIAAAFGTIDALRYNLTAALRAELRLLRGAEALETAERLHGLRERIASPGLRAASEGCYALALAALGRQREAEAVLDAAERGDADVPADLKRFAKQARAEIAWQRGDAAGALAAASAALAVWPRGDSAEADQRAHVALLAQRASIAAGRPEAADIAALDGAGDDATKTYRLLAAAEWAASREDADAERLFRDAAASAESDGVPDTLVLTAEAEARWLLERGRAEDAAARAGRVAVFADRDYDSAVLQAAVFHATGRVDAWKRAVEHAGRLAGERQLPKALRAPPAPRNA